MHSFIYPLSFFIRSFIPQEQIIQTLYVLISTSRVRTTAKGNILMLKCYSKIVCFTGWMYSVSYMLYIIIHHSTAFNYAFIHSILYYHHQSSSIPIHLSSIIIRTIHLSSIIIHTIHLSCRVCCRRKSPGYNPDDEQPR